jgi:hypothetical protein
MHCSGGGVVGLSDHHYVRRRVEVPIDGNKIGRGIEAELGGPPGEGAKQRLGALLPQALSGQLVQSSNDDSGYSVG